MHILQELYSFVLKTVNSGLLVVLEFRTVFCIHILQNAIQSPFIARQLMIHQLFGAPTSRIYPQSCMWIASVDQIMLCSFYDQRVSVKPRYHIFISLSLYRFRLSSMVRKPITPVSSVEVILYIVFSRFLFKPFD